MANPPKPFPPPTSPLLPLKKRMSTNESLSSFLRLGGAGKKVGGGRKEDGAKFLKVEMWKEKREEEEEDRRVEEEDKRKVEGREVMEEGGKRRDEGEIRREEGKEEEGRRDESEIVMKEEEEGKVEYVDPTTGDDMNEIEKSKPGEIEIVHVTLIIHYFLTFPNNSSRN